MSSLETTLRDILTEKKNKIIPSNIKQGVTIFGVEGSVEVAEDLDTELDTQDTIIADIKSALNDRGNDKLNLFVQQDEPLLKKGIWLQTDKQVNNIIQDENVFASEQWNTTKMNKLRESVKWGASVGASIVGDYVYMWGGNGSISNYGYKYNVKTDTYTQIANSTVSYQNGCRACSIGTNIYIFGEQGSNQKALRMYNTLTNTYSSKASCPAPSSSSYYGWGGAMTVKGTDIYVNVKPEFGNPTYMFKYDSINNIYTSLNSIPYSATSGISMCALDDYIYIFGGLNSSTFLNKAYKYSITNNTYTQITNLPNTLSDAVTISIGKYVYILGGRTGFSTYNNVIYRYDTITNTYTQFNSYDTLGYGFVPIIVNVDNGKELYLFGGYNNNDIKKVKIMTLVPKSYDKDNAIILSQNPDYKYTTELVESDVINGLQYEFNDVYYYTQEGGLDNTIPTYYGDGTQWIKFKN